MSSSPGGSSKSPYFSLFLRAIGIKPGFRRTGPSSLINIAVVAAIGVISGRYIFQEPLEEYWKEQRQLEAAAKAANANNGANANASTVSGANAEQK